MLRKRRPLALPVRPQLFLLAGALGLIAALGGMATAQPPAPAAAPAASAETGMVTIESDRQQADNRTGIVTATGNVRITYPDRKTVATSRQAQYFSREGRLVLTGDVDVVDADGQRVKGERLVYMLDSERLSVDPPSGRQVFSRLKLQMQPPQAAPAKPAPAKPEPATAVPSPAAQP
jgi:lipopolysaccharide export system protein LptA